MWGLGSCRWWPFVGLFLFGLPIVFGVFGFRCDRTDPGVTTDPGTTVPQNAPDAQSPAPSTFVSFAPIAGGLVAAGLALRRNRDS